MMDLGATIMKKETSGKKGRASSIDEHVGAKLKQRRTLIGMSQEKLAEAVGITFQQIQKYENGANRVSAGRLYEFSKILEVPVAFFFDNVHSPAISASIGLSDNTQESFAPQEQAIDVMQRKETIDLVRAYYEIDSDDQRKELLKMVRSMVKAMKTN